jgi:hypothetical protein
MAISPAAEVGLCQAQAGTLILSSGGNQGCPVITRGYLLSGDRDPDSGDLPATGNPQRFQHKSIRP